MTRMKAPELVAPAGTLEKLKTAFNFGADAVYLGGKEYSLRAQAGNFTSSEMKEGIKVAHGLGKKVYVTVNAFMHNGDIEGISLYFRELAELGVDGLIISDPGALVLARDVCPGVPITISTQASVTNYLSAGFYSKQGAKRIVMARELNLDEISEIKQRTGIEVEVFVHGAMCISYSGRCWLSYAMTGRDANRGECAHPCRYRYRLEEEKRPGQYFSVHEDDRGTYVMNSKDLCLVEYIPQLIAAGVDAFKIEGRMKSPYYVATVVKTYRQAIDFALAGEPPAREQWLRELSSVSTRPFTPGFIPGKPEEGQDLLHQAVPERAAFCGIIRGYEQYRRCLLVEQRAPFSIGEELEIIEPGNSFNRTISIDRMWDAELKEITVARHPRELIWVESGQGFKPGSIMARPPRPGGNILI